MAKKIKITLQRTPDTSGLPSDKPYQIKALVNAVTVSTGSDEFRVGDKLTEQQAEGLNRSSRYEVTVTLK